METLKKYYPYLILLSAFLLSGVSAYYSVFGVGKIFSGANVESMIMAAGLEVSKTVLAGALHIYWAVLRPWLKYYLTGALFVLMFITSMGIYGFLSDAYHKTSQRESEVTAKTELVKKKRDLLTTQMGNLTLQRNQLDQSLAQLRKSISTDNQYQTVVNGKVITQIQSTSKKAVNEQLNIANAQSAQLDAKISMVNDSLLALDLRVIELEHSDRGGELGALKYLSALTGATMDQVVNVFMLILIFVFDPLAICLVLAALFAFTPLSPVKPTKLPVKKENPVEGKSRGFMERLIPSSLYQIPNFGTFTETKIYSVPKEPTPEGKKRGRPRKVKPTETVAEMPVEVEGQTPQKKFDFEIPTEPEQVIPMSIPPASQPERPKRKRKSTVVETDLPTQVTTSINDAVKNEENKKKV